MVRCSALAAAMLPLILVAACATPGAPGRGRTEPVRLGERQTFQTLDVMERAIAGDIAVRLGWLGRDGAPDPTYDVQVYRGGPALGTLVQGGPNRLVNSTVCRPATMPEWGAINVFATYEITGNLAFKLGLPIPSVPVGLSAGGDLTSSYALTDAEMLFVPADELAALIQTRACRARIDALEQPVWIVRGIIRAKRAYNFYVKRSSGLAFTIPGAGETGLSGYRSDKGAGQDSAARAYFMILTPVRPRVTPPPLPAPAGPVQCPPLANRIYVQQDRRDDPAKGAALVSALGTAGFRSVPEVEKLDGDRVPQLAQVRYFYDGDLVAAECALQLLRRTQPAAVLRRLALAAPPGQLEVWLPRVR